MQARRRGDVMTLPRCIDPATGERVLTEPRGSDVEMHVAACEACRVDAERASRLAEAWRQDEPDASELAAARSRLRGRGVTRGRSRALPLAIAFAVMLGGAGALAGGKVLSERSRHAARTVEAPTRMAEADMPMHSTPHAPAARLNQTVPSNPVSPPPVIETAAATTPAAQAAPAPGPTSHPASRASSRAASPEASAPTATWSAAADAMRSGDYDGAERAFDELARSPDVRTRDEARLARAQVLAAGGHVDEARTELQSLARAGATALVRTRAAEALHSFAATPLTPPAAGN
jgi:Tetratricopeptide repeat